MSYPTTPIVGIDFETAPTTTQNPWPFPVCLSVSGGEDSLSLRDALVAEAG